MDRYPVIPWPQSFHTLVISSCLQFFGVTIAASSADVFCARLAFGSAMIALGATAGSIWKFRKEIKEG